jgi:hypothetical protein
MLTQPARRLAALCIFVSAACLTANSLPDKNDKKEEGNVLLNSALEMVNLCKAGQQWRFRPATCAGKPVPTEINVDVTFHLY